MKYSLLRRGVGSCLSVVVVPVDLKALHEEEKFHGPCLCRQGSQGIKRENDLPKACMERCVKRCVLAVVPNLNWRLLCVFLCETAGFRFAL